jgi:alpha-L-fucosidase
MPSKLMAQNNQFSNLRELQQKFIDLKFGMFIHFNIPTFMNQDWADPEAKADIFNPVKLDCNQWAEAAVSAKMSYGCLTTKHHSGFCIWDTKTTDYSVMNSPFKRDVVKEYADAFRKNGLKIMLYYSILDTHHNLRPGHITNSHIKMVKDQLTELLTNYGEIEAIIIDGWDAPWSRISYEDIPFEEIYRHIKQIQPNCLLMDLNAAKYPADALFYTDIKSYEQGAGQHISRESNKLPAMSCLPINENWFWKEHFPVEDVKDPVKLVKENLEPLNEVYCNFLLNVAPNNEGLIDENALYALKNIGEIWQNDIKYTHNLPLYDEPIISENIAKHKPVNSSWSDDMWISDFGNDDNFRTAWRSNRTSENPWYEVDLGKVEPFNMITIVDNNNSINYYDILYNNNGKWEVIFSGENNNKIKVHRFSLMFTRNIKIQIKKMNKQVTIEELGVYFEQRD